MSEIVINGVEELVSKLFAATADKTLRPPMNRSLFKLQAFMAKYPSKSSGKPMAGHWVSEKQRRWFFAALHSGEITVPYVRKGSAGLGGSWTSRVGGFAGDMTGLVGTNKSYAPMVQGAGRQMWMHEGNWQTEEDAVKKERDGIVQDFAESIEGAMSR